MADQFLQICAPQLAKSQSLISKLCMATDKALKNIGILNRRVSSIKANKIINYHKVAVRCKDCQMVLNKRVSEIKEFGILVEFGLPPLLSLDGDELIIEQVMDVI